MQQFTVILLKTLIYPLSYLPLSILYKVGQVIAFLLEKVLGYRKKVVMQNLQRCFPEKSDKERKQIAHDFYHFLASLMVEGIKSFTMPLDESVKRCHINNPELLNKYFDEGRNVVMVFGHNENWEWPALACNSQLKHRVAAIYKPVKNQPLNHWIKENRSRYGSLLLSMKETYPYYESNPKELTANAFIADQNPGNVNNAIWVDFFGSPTAFISGPARVAQKFNLPIVFVDILEPRKGYYTLDVEYLVKNPQALSETEITQKFATRLEAKIRKNPAYWLWSHKRWKHKFEDVAGNND
jgi:Kdo2-lipid IVA lauroyltransferase/acyltransferase